MWQEWTKPYRDNQDKVSTSLDTTSKTSTDTRDIAPLHGENYHLILLIDPEKEGPGSVVEDTMAIRPVTLHTSNSEVTVSNDEGKYIIKIPFIQAPAFIGGDTVEMGIKERT